MVEANIYCDGLSEFDVENMTKIIKGNLGDWYQAKLLRALHILLPAADENNLDRLKQAYPGTVAAYILWYDGRLNEIVGEEELDAS